MRRQGGGFGAVMLVVVMAIVLYLASKAWKKIAPTALEVHDPTATAGESVKAGVPPGEQPPLRPSLREMKQSTASHARAVGDALQQAN